LTVGTPGTVGTAALEWSDANSSVLTFGMTKCFLTPGPCEARRAGTHIRLYTGGSVAAARPADRPVTGGTCPARPAQAGPGVTVGVALSVGTTLAPLDRGVCVLV